MQENVVELCNVLPLFQIDTVPLGSPLHLLEAKPFLLQRRNCKLI